MTPMDKYLNNVRDVAKIKEFGNAANFLKSKGMARQLRINEGSLKTPFAKMTIEKVQNMKKNNPDLFSELLEDSHFRERIDEVANDVEEVLAGVDDSGADAMINSLADVPIGIKDLNRRHGLKNILRQQGMSDENIENSDWL